jgi:hypothetical protein
VDVVDVDGAEHVVAVAAIVAVIAVRCAVLGIEVIATRIVHEVAIADFDASGVGRAVVVASAVVVGVVGVAGFAAAVGAVGVVVRWLVSDVVVAGVVVVAGGLCLRLCAQVHIVVACVWYVGLFFQWLHCGYSESSRYTGVEAITSKRACKANENMTGIDACIKTHLVVQRISLAPPRQNNHTPLHIFHLPSRCRGCQRIPQPGREEWEISPDGAMWPVVSCVSMSMCFQGRSSSHAWTSSCRVDESDFTTPLTSAPRCAQI